MSILITICARGGSKGIPGKNIKPLNKKPLINYTISIALELREKLDNVIIGLSTDSGEITKVCRGLGLDETYTRPHYLAGDNVGKIDAIRDIKVFKEKEHNCEFDYVIDLDVTSPLRTVNDVQNAMMQLENNAQAVNIFSVSPASRNPYFNMVENNEAGFAQVVKPLTEIKSRQQAPAVYDMNASFYIFKSAYFEQGFRVSTTNKSLAYVMDHICFDLDEPHDFLFMDFLLKEKLLDFVIEGE